MGLPIDREDFSEAEYQRYSERLYECLAALKHQIRQRGFGLATPKIGAELENYIVDEGGRVMPINQEIIAASDNPGFTVELNRFNLEINLEPVELDAFAFSTLERSMAGQLANLGRVAERFGAKIVPTGILPTLQDGHLTPEYMTDCARYRALSKHLLAMRGKNFEVNIRGQDSLRMSRDHVALEGANTSFQFHLMVKPEDFADVFNATQLITSLLVAVAANSPILLGRVLWDETRIALFKQSIDSRARDDFDWRQPARVSFGHGWVRIDAWELFAETVALYPPIFPILSSENPLQAIKSGKIPRLEELSLHMGTTWPWNRAVYSGAGEGHVRIEMRALPAGPSIADMCANAALATGLAMGFKDTIGDFLAVMPFKFAEYNFYRAAQSGLDASIIWTDPKKHQLVEMPVSEVIYNMLPIAERGLSKIGIDRKEISHYLTLIKNRLDKKITGARWQKQQLGHFEKSHNREIACKKMFARYVANQRANQPVSDWNIEVR